MVELNSFLFRIDFQIQAGSLELKSCQVRWLQVHEVPAWTWNRFQISRNYMLIFVYLGHQSCKIVVDTWAQALCSWTLRFFLMLGDACIPIIITWSNWYIESFRKLVLATIWWGLSCEFLCVQLTRWVFLTRLRICILPDKTPLRAWTLRLGEVAWPTHQAPHLWVLKWTTSSYSVAPTRTPKLPSPIHSPLYRCLGATTCTSHRTLLR